MPINPSNNNNNSVKKAKKTPRSTTNLNGGSKKVKTSKSSSQARDSPLVKYTRRAPYFSVLPVPAKLASKFKEAICIKGQDLLSDLATPDTLTTGTQLANIFINPSEFTGSRLKQFSGLYEKYVFSKLKLHYQPAVPTTTSGAIILSHDKDVADKTPSDGIEGARIYLAMMDSVCTSVWDPVTLSTKLADPQDFYYTQAVTGESGTERTVYQGQFYIACLENVPISTTLGCLWLEYEIYFFDPTNEVVDPFITAANKGIDKTFSGTGSGYDAWSAIGAISNFANAGSPKFGTVPGLNVGGFVIPIGGWSLESVVQNLSATAQGNSTSAPLVAYKPDGTQAVANEDFIATLLNYADGGTGGKAFYQLWAVQVLAATGLWFAQGMSSAASFTGRPSARWFSVNDKFT